jgi:hypothetical protein
MPALPWLRILALIGVVVAVATFVAVPFFLSRHDAVQVERARTETAGAREEAKGAHAQAQINAGVAERTTGLVVRERAITQEVSRAREEIRLAQDVSCTAVVAAWAAGIDRVRRDAEAARGDHADGGAPLDRLAAVFENGPPGDPRDGDAGRAADRA